MTSTLTGSTETRAPGTEPRGRWYESPIVGLLRGLTWVFAGVAAVPTRADPDLWGNVRFGLDMLGSWQVSTTDIYSFTQDIPWFNHEWLAQLMMAVSYAVAGSPGLVALKVLLVLFTLWLVKSAYHGTRPLLAEGAMLLVLAGSIPIIVTLRAQLWSFVGLAALTRLLESSSSRTLFFIPLLFAVWVNCHIGWVIGFAVLVWWALGTTVRGDRAARNQACAIVAASFLATLVNPYGWDVWRFTAGTTHLARNLTEWQSLWTTPAYNWLPWLAAAGLTMVSALRVPRLPFERGICLVVLAFVSARAVKFAALFVELTVLSLAPIARRQWPERPNEKVVAPAFRWVNRAVTVVVSVVALNVSWARIHCLPADDWRPDATVARALIDSRAAGRIAVWFDWGEYVIWHRGPDLRVSFDPRYDLLYSSATIDEQEQVARGTRHGTAFLARSRPEYVWYPQSMTALKQWVAANGYRLDIETPESFLAVRADLETIPRPSDQVFGCFPAP